jgi:ArsR family transcriptional regulator, arsenate/arsenite/antimonite-responsive transcriptional repressor
MERTEGYNKVDISLARFARAMAHPARISILRLLSVRKSCYFNEISKTLPLAESTVSQHLTELKSAGLIVGNSEPPKIKYSISIRKLKKVRKLLKGMTKIKAE